MYSLPIWIWISRMDVLCAYLQISSCQKRQLCRFSNMMLFLLLLSYVPICIFQMRAHFWINPRDWFRKIFFSRVVPALVRVLLLHHVLHVRNIYYTSRDTRLRPSRIRMKTLKFAGSMQAMIRGPELFLIARPWSGPPWTHSSPKNCTL